MADSIVVRIATEADEGLAGSAADLIMAAAAGSDMALRPVALLLETIRSGRAVLALDGQELVGFGYWSEWGNGRFIAHSGLVVRPDKRGLALGRRLKLALFESSRSQRPQAILMSLTSSPAVQALNRSLGYETVPLNELTDDPAFWEGCSSCRNYTELLSHREWCRCDGMLRKPDETGEQE